MEKTREVFKIYNSDMSRNHSTILTNLRPVLNNAPNWQQVVLDHQKLLETIHSFKSSQMLNVQ